MARKKKNINATPCSWQISTDFVANSRHLSPGTEIKIRGEKGRFKFLQHIRTATAEWIDVRDKDGRFRSFHPERIKTVHTKQQLRQGKT